MNTELTNFPDAPDIESSTADYACRFKGNVGTWFLEVQAKGIEYILQQAKLGNSPVNVLDVGGGHGQNIAIMQRLNNPLTILGSNLDCSRLIEQHIAQQKVAFVTGDLKHIPFPDKHFNVVICLRVLAHIANWQALVSELCRVASSLVIVDFASKRSINAATDLLIELKKSAETNTRNYRLHGIHEVEAAFAAAGAEPLVCYPQFMWPMAIHRMLKMRAASVALEAVSRVLGLTTVFGSPVLYGFKIRHYWE